MLGKTVALSEIGPIRFSCSRQKNDPSLLVCTSERFYTSNDSFPLNKYEIRVSEVTRRALLQNVNGQIARKNEIDKHEKELHNLKKTIKRFGYNFEILG